MASDEALVITTVTVMAGVFFFAMLGLDDNWTEVIPPRIRTPIPHRLVAFMLPKATEPLIDIFADGNNVSPAAVPSARAEAYGTCSRRNPCHIWWCERCERVRTHREAKRLVRRMADRPCLWVTLTMRHWSDRLWQQREMLMQAFRNIRQTKGWKDMVVGGKGYLHVRGRNGNGAHLHLVAEVRLGVDPDEFANLLAESWKGFADVRAVLPTWRNRYRVAHYATKGIVLQHRDIDEEERAEALVRARDALKGKTKAVTFGTWRKRVSADEMENPDSDRFGDIESVLLDHVRRAEIEAILLDAHAVELGDERVQRVGAEWWLPFLDYSYRERRSSTCSDGSVSAHESALADVLDEPTAEGIDVCDNYNLGERPPTTADEAGDDPPECPIYLPSYLWTL